MTLNHVEAGQHITDALWNDLVDAINDTASVAQFNVKLYGATGDGTTNDTVAVQAAMDAIKAFEPAGAETRAVLYFPSGIYLISSIDCTGPNLSEIGLTIEGDGAWSTFIKPSTSAVNVFDVSGVKECTIRRMQIGKNDVVPVPDSAIFSGVIDGANPTDVLILEDLYVSGTFTGAAIWIYGTVSSRAHRVRAYNYSSSANRSAIMLTHDNDPWGTGVVVSSDFVTTDTADFPITDWDFSHCEGHVYNVPSSGAVLWLDGVGGFSWNGGNMSGDAVGQAPCVRITDGTAGAGGSSKQLAFRDVKFYAENGPPNAAAAIVIASGEVADLSIESCVVATDTTIVQVASGLTVTRLTMHNTTQKSSGTSVVAPASGNITLALPDIDCTALNLSVGSGGSITGGHLYRPGTITASTNTAVTHSSAGVTRYRSGIIEVGVDPATAGSIRLDNNTVVTFKGNGINFLSGIGSDTANNINIGQTTDVVDVNVRASTTINLSIGGATKVSASATGVAFNGATIAAPPNFTITNATADRLTLDQTSATAAEVREVLGTVVKYLIGNGNFS